MNTEIKNFPRGVDVKGLLYLIWGGLKSISESLAVIASKEESVSSGESGESGEGDESDEPVESGTGDNVTHNVEDTPTSQPTSQTDQPSEAGGNGDSEVTSEVTP